MNEKVKFIKNLFNVIFPYNVSFRVKFFDHLEGQEGKAGEENLEIIGTLLQLLQNQKSHEREEIINSIVNKLKEKGISIDIS